MFYSMPEINLSMEKFILEACLERRNYTPF